MSLLLLGLALTSPFAIYLLVKDPGSGRGFGVAVIGLGGAVDGWWD